MCGTSVDGDGGAAALGSPIGKIMAGFESLGPLSVLDGPVDIPTICTVEDSLADRVA